MPRTAQIEVYKFSELSDAAKVIAKTDYGANWGYPEADDAIKSLEALAEHFMAKLGRHEIDFFDSSPSSIRLLTLDMEVIGNLNLPDNIERSIGYSAATEEDIKAAYEKWLAAKLDELGSYNPETLKGLRDCKLTGHWTDEPAIDGFRKAYFNGERDLENLLPAAAKSWLQAVQEDCKSQYEDENFSEYADANDLEYTKDGKRFVG